MKKTLTFISLAIIICLLTTNSIAQTVFNFSDYQQIDDSLLYSVDNLPSFALDFEQTGEDFYWDYSELVYESQQNQTTFSSNAGGYQFLWCLLNGYIFDCDENWGQLTNRSAPFIDSLNLGPLEIQNSITHQLYEGNTLQNTMLAITPIIAGIPAPLTYEYQNPDTVYQFPIEFGGSDSSTSRLEILTPEFSPLFVSLSSNLKRSNSVEGWGTLETPYGVFPDVLKMKTVIEHFDTLTVDAISFPTNYSTVEYKWWDPNYGLPVLTASGNLIADIPVITSVTYLDSARCVAPLSLFAYLPLIPNLDPMTHEVNVDFFNLSFNADSVIWNFGDGSSSTEYSPSHVYQCSGLLDVQLIAFNDCDTIMEVDTLNFPLLITDTDFVLDTSLVELCQGDSLLIADSYQSENGFFLNSSTSTLGCDSLSIVELVVLDFENEIVPQQDTLYSSSTGDSYQWLNCEDDFDPIIGENQPYFIPTESGNYSVEVFIGNCSYISECFSISVVGVPNLNSDEIRMYPNPVTDVLHIEKGTQSFSIIWIINMLGEVVLESEELEIDVSSLPVGTYVLAAKNQNGIVSHQRFIKD